MRYVQTVVMQTTYLCHIAVIDSRRFRACVIISDKLTIYFVIQLPPIYNKQAAGCPPSLVHK